MKRRLDRNSEPQRDDAVYKLVEYAQHYREWEERFEIQILGHVLKVNGSTLRRGVLGSVTVIWFVETREGSIPVVRVGSRWMEVRDLCT